MVMMQCLRRLLLLADVAWDVVMVIIASNAATDKWNKNIQKSKVQHFTSLPCASSAIMR